MNDRLTVTYNIPCDKQHVNLNRLNELVEKYDKMLATLQSIATGCCCLCEGNNCPSCKAHHVLNEIGET